MNEKLMQDYTMAYLNFVYSHIKGSRDEENVLKRFLSMQRALLNKGISPSILGLLKKEVRRSILRK